MRYNKLVRDRIPEIIKARGKKANYRILDESEFIDYLEKKLDEEVAEFHKKKSIEELADVVEVLMTLITELGYSGSDVYKKRCLKSAERGNFDKRICLIDVE